MQSAEASAPDRVPVPALLALDTLLGQEWAKLSDLDQERACEIVRRLAGAHIIKQWRQWPKVLSKRRSSGAPNICSHECHDVFVNWLHSGILPSLAAECLQSPPKSKPCAAGAADGAASMPLASAIDSPRLQSAFAYCALERQLQRLQTLDQADVTALVRDMSGQGDPQLVVALAAAPGSLQAEQASRRAWCLAAALPLPWSAESAATFRGELAKCFQVRCVSMLSISYGHMMAAALLHIGHECDPDVFVELRVF